jgi:hypothetical protein
MFGGQRVIRRMRKLPKRVSGHFIDHEPRLRRLSAGAL